MGGGQLGHDVFQPPSRGVIPSCARTGPTLYFPAAAYFYAVAAADGVAYTVATTAAVTSTTVWYAPAATFTKLNFCFMLVDMPAE